jgi:hypothetical protein
LGAVAIMAISLTWPGALALPASAEQIHLAAAADLSLAGEWLSTTGTTYIFTNDGGGSFSGYVQDGGCASTPGDIQDTSQGNGAYSGTENTFSSSDPCTVAGTATNTIQVSSDGKSAEWNSGGCSDCGPQSWTRVPPSLVITSPASATVIALTDGKYVQPQPTANERTPAHRHLMVSGTAKCGLVDVNGVSAKVSGGKWKADVPVSGTGPLTLNAHGTGCGQATSKVTLIDLRVVHPTEDQSLPLTAEPAMPAIKADLEVVGLAGGQADAVTFTWTLQVINRYVVPKNHWVDDIRTVATGTTTGTQATWQPSGLPVIGGWGKITVKADIPGVAGGIVTSEPRWINIPGTNPGEAAVTAFINAHSDSSADASALVHLACHESHGTFGQFGESAQPLKIVYGKKNSKKVISIPAKSDKIPSGWPNPAPLRPLFGYPSGIGVMQLDPADFPEEQWDWQSNVLGGISLFAEKKAFAAAWPAREQVLINELRARDLRIVNAARAAKNLKPITVREVLVSDHPETTGQLAEDAIRGYNGYGSPAIYHQYTFDPHYVMSADHLDLKVSGTPGWALTSIPAEYHPDYVQLVMACE